MTRTKTKSATEASAAAAMAVAVALAFSGAYIPAAIAGAIGLLLFLAYEKLNVQNVELSEEEIEQISERTSDVIEDAGQ